MGATITGVAGAGAEVGLSWAGAVLTVPGFAGKDGCSGGVAAEPVASVDCVDSRGGAPSGAGVPGVGAGAGAGVDMGAGDGAAEAAAFARAWAMRSAVLANCFFLISIRASSCLIFLT